MEQNYNKIKDVKDSFAIECNCFYAKGDSEIRDVDAFIINDILKDLIKKFVIDYSDVKMKKHKKDELDDLITKEIFLFKIDFDSILHEIVEPKAEIKVPKGTKSKVKILLLKTIKKEDEYNIEWKHDIKIELEYKEDFRFCFSNLIKLYYQYHLIEKQASWEYLLLNDENFNNFDLTFSKYYLYLCFLKEIVYNPEFKKDLLNEMML